MDVGSIMITVRNRWGLSDLLYMEALEMHLYYISVSIIYKAYKGKIDGDSFAGSLSLYDLPPMRPG